MNRLSVSTLIILFFLNALGAEEAPFRVPDGFTVSRFAGDDLTHDTWAMTIDRKGRVAVSGPGYIKILLDTDHDGAADTSHLVTAEARQAHGLLFAEGDLFSVQPRGIFRHRDKDRDGLPEAAPELFSKLPGRGGEHGPHGLRQGPDGWFYLACGNNTGISEKDITTQTSPVLHPEQGTVLRISPDGRQSEVIAHGFRNHYDLAFNKHGHLFTFDSDGERDHQLPWYSFCRLFHVRVGGHHGWLLPGHQRSFNRPPYFFDSVDRLIEIDRGSPTGVEVYRHTQFPARYRDGLFFACWTYGRVYFTSLERKGDTYRRHQPEIFLETTGNLGFAPSDLAVHPSGDLFVSVGGRGTRGSIYRVSFPAGRPTATALPPYETTTDWSIHAQAIKSLPRHSPEQALGLFRADPRPSYRLFAIRQLMLALGDISTSEAKRRIDAGYTANHPDSLDPALRDAVIHESASAFEGGTTQNGNLQFELSRLLAMLHAESADPVRKVAAALTPTSHPTADAHHLFCLAQLPGPRDDATRSRIAAAFLQLDQKLTRRHLLTDRNWPLNIRDALQAHLELDPQLGNQVKEEAAFGHPSQAYLLKLLPEEIQSAGAKKMLGVQDGWNAQALSFVQLYLSPQDLLPLYRSQWTHPDLRPVLTGYLASQGNADDRKRVEEFYRPPATGIDLAPLNERLSKVDWSKGDAQRGQIVYARFTCTACHSGNTRLGPDLKNIAKRFSRDDLFRHINEPNLAVSDLYKAIQITTRDGTYVGVPVYESEAQTILETGVGETIRFSRHDILTERRPNQSPMPAGLLLSASVDDLADLYAYLNTL